MTIALDLLTVGRISVDLFSEQINTPFSQPQTFQKSIGGSPTNVAVAAAKLGRKSAIVTKVGVDPLGEFVVNKLASFGVNTDFVKVAESGLTPVVLASLRYQGFVERFRAAFAAESKAFSTFVGGQIENPCPPEFAREALKVAIACERSIISKQPETI